MPRSPQKPDVPRRTGENQRRPVDHRSVHHLPLAAALPFVCRGDDAERHEHPAAGEVAEDVDRWCGRLPRAAERLERTGDREVVDVVTGGIGQRPFLAPSGQFIRTRGVIAVAHHVGADSEPLGDAGPVQHDQDAGAIGDAEERADALW